MEPGNVTPRNQPPTQSMDNLQSIFHFKFRSQWSTEYLWPVFAIYCSLWLLTLSFFSLKYISNLPCISCSQPVISLWCTSEKNLALPFLHFALECLKPASFHFLFSILIKSGPLVFPSFSLNILCSRPLNSSVALHWLIPLFQYFLSTGETKMGIMLWMLHS